MTTIAVSTTSTTAFTVSADTSGSLVLQTGATPTTALTLDASQNASLAGSLTVPSATVTGTMTAGAVAVPTGTLHGLVLGTAQASTSGTSIDFTGIPSWVKRITVMFNGVSTNAAGSSAVIVQLGVSGTAVTTGYTTVVSALGASSVSTVISTTAGFVASSSIVNAAVFTGQMVISNLTGNTWVASNNCARTDSAVITLSDGSVSLSGTMNLVRITTVNGTDTFDAGSINIMYEG